MLLALLWALGLSVLAFLLVGIGYVLLNLSQTNERESLSTVRDESCPVATPGDSAHYGKSSALSDIFDVLPGAMRVRNSAT